MRDQISVTISGVHGSRHYNLGRALRQAAMGVGVVLLLIGVIAAVFLYVLNNEVGDLSAQRDALVTEHDALAAQKYELEQVVKQERLHLAEMGESLSRIEALIGVSDDTTRADIAEITTASAVLDAGESLVARARMAELNSYEKQILLSSIPSGSPLEGKWRLSSSFGWRTHPVLGERHFHTGMDMAIKRGTPIYASADGVVEFAGKHDSGYGNLVLLVHAYSFRSMYAHLDKISVKPRDVVKKGDLLGTVGMTGLTTGPHLHYEVSFAQKPLNPKPFVDWGVEAYNSIFDTVSFVPWPSLINLIHYRHQLSPTNSTGGGRKSIVADGCLVRGEITVADSLHIDGKVEGNVYAQGNVSIGTHGVVTGFIYAKHLVVSGTLAGNAYCAILELLKGGFLEGDITAETLHFEAGARFVGRSYDIGDEAFRNQLAEPVQKQLSAMAPLADGESGDADRAADDTLEDAVVVKDTAKKSSKKGA